MSGSRVRVMTVFGTRPEAIKMAPVVQAMRRREDRVEPVVVVTAQHREMLDQVLDVFDMKPDMDLNVMRHGQTLAQVTSRVLTGLDRVFSQVRPSIVLVHGDTTTTFTAGLAAFYHKIPVGHVEAGLRTSNRYDPYPEEMNRRLVGALAEMHFAPTTTARDNLLAENVRPEDVYLTGNTVIDALLETVAPSYRFDKPSLQNLDFARRRVLLVTTHRRENLGEPMRRIYRALRQILVDFSDVEVVFTVHKNPAVRALVDQELAGQERLHLIEPLAYKEFANLMARCHMVLTDSGGLQEEAPALGKPVLVLRETTERPEGIAAGTCVQVGTQTGTIVATASRLLANEDAYRQMAQAVNPYGDGKAAQRIVDAIMQRYLDF